MKYIVDRFRKLFKSLVLGIAFATVVLVCAPSAVCADASFAVASTAPATTAAATQDAPKTPPATEQSPPAPTWTDRILAIVSSGSFLTGLVYVFLRLETYLQAKTSLNLAKAVGAAHSVFNALFDVGLIKNGSFRTAEEAFFSEFNTQFFNAYGHAPDSDAQDTAHAEFAQLFTDHTSDSIPAVAPQV